MTKALVRGELQRLRSNWAFLIMMAILTMLSVLYVFMQTNAYFITDQTMLNMMGMSNDLVEEGPDIFWRIITDSSAVSWFSLPFAALFIGTDFQGRGFSQVLMAGHSRKKLFFAKTIEYYIFFLLILAIYPVGAILRCCLPWIKEMNAVDVAYFWQGTSLKIVLDMNWISVSFFLAFLCRDILKTIMVTFGMLCLTPLFPTISVGKNIRSLNPLEYFSYTVRRPNPIPGTMWDVPPLSTAEILVIVIGSFLVITACITGAYLLFRKSELK